MRTSLIPHAFGIAAACIASISGAQCYHYEPVARAPGPVSASLTVFDPDGPEGPRPDLLIAAGTLSFDTTLPPENIAAYDGQDWVHLGADLDGSVSQCLVWRNLLVIAGTFSHVAGQQCNGLASWDGSTWQPLGASLTRSGTRTWSLSIAVSQNDLFVTGDITHAQGQPVSFLTRFDGTAWHDVQGGIDTPQAYLVSWANRVVVAHWQELHRAGNIAVNGAAVWSASGWQRLDLPRASGTFCGAVGSTLYMWTQTYQIHAGYLHELFANDGTGWVVIDTGRSSNYSADGNSWAVRREALYRVDYGEILASDYVRWMAVSPISGALAAPRFSTTGGIGDWAFFRGKWFVSGGMTALNGQLATAITSFDPSGVESIWSVLSNPVRVGFASRAGLFATERTNTDPFAYEARLLRQRGGLWSTEFTLTGTLAEIRLGLSDHTTLARLFTLGQVEYRSLEGDEWIPAPALSGKDMTFVGSWRGDLVGRVWASPDGAYLGLCTITPTGVTPLPAGGPATPSQVLDVNGDLIAIDSSSNPPVIARFDGQSWSTISNDRVWLATVHEGRLWILANGRPADAGQSRFDFRWLDDTGWHDVAGGLTCESSGKIGLFSFDRSLFLAGSLQTVNGTPVWHVARFDGGQWRGVVVNDQHSIESVAANAQGIMLVEGYGGGVWGGVRTGPYAFLRRASTCNSDLNCDGGIDGTDVEAYFLLWERSAPGADLNSDGGVDGGDVEAFFSDWSAGC